MAVRPFYLEADVDGRATSLSGGPRNAHGNMSITITQRNEGAVTTAFRVRCYRDGDELVTAVYDKAGSKVAENRTRY